jgi:hypothetical protein
VCVSVCHSWNYWNDGPLPPSHPSHPSQQGKLSVVPRKLSADVPPVSTVFQDILRNCSVVPFPALPHGIRVTNLAAPAFPDIEDCLLPFKMGKDSGKDKGDATPTVIDVSVAGDGGTGVASDEDITRQVKRMLSLINPGTGFVLRIKTGLCDDVSELNKKVSERFSLLLTHHCA